MIYSYFQHPQSVCMSYFAHCMFSLKLARYFALGSMKALIHAFMPTVFTTSSTDLILAVKAEMEAIGCR